MILKLYYMIVGLVALILCFVPTIKITWSETSLFSSEIECSAAISAFEWLWGERESVVELNVLGDLKSEYDLELEEEDLEILFGKVDVIDAISDNTLPRINEMDEFVFSMIVVGGMIGLIIGLSLLVIREKKCQSNPGRAWEKVYQQEIAFSRYFVWFAFGFMIPHALLYGCWSAQKQPIYKPDFTIAIVYIVFWFISLIMMNVFVDSKIRKELAATNGCMTHEVIKAMPYLKSGYATKGVSGFSEGYDTIQQVGNATKKNRMKWNV